MSALRLIIAVAILAVTIEAGVNYPAHRARNSPPRPQCGINEHYTNCGTACEPKCGDPEFMPCTLQCIVGVCQCIHGHSRNSQGICIPNEECYNDLPDYSYDIACNRPCPRTHVCQFMNDCSQGYCKKIPVCVSAFPYMPYQ